jgi:hypothetical protein
MKKKLWLIILMLIVSVGVIFISKSLQNNSEMSQSKIENTQSSSENKQESLAENQVATPKVEVPGSNTIKQTENKPSTEKSDSEKKDDNASKTTEKKETKPMGKAVPEQKPNFIVTDTITGNTLLSKKVVFNGETAAKITIQVLDNAKINYRTSGIGSTLYFSSIGGLKEREAGELSGWCYYVNGEKISVGAGSYKLGTNDVIEWKYLKDGISN